MDHYRDFVKGPWCSRIDVRDFIQRNYTPYQGDESFLEDASDATKKLWDQVMDLTRQEAANGGVLDMDTKVVSTITSHGPGYLDRQLETIVGLQTDKPFKRSLQPYGGIRMAQRPARITAIRSIQISVNFSRSIAKPITKVSLICILRKCGPAALPISLPGFRMPMVVEGSSVIIDALHCMEWIG